MAINWYEMGYTAALAKLTHSPISCLYPHRDVYNEDDETAYFRGYNECVRQFHTDGINTIAAYSRESKNNV